MKYITLIFIVLASIFNNAVAINGADVYNTLFIGDNANTEASLADFHYTSLVQESAPILSISQSYSEGSSRTIYFVEFEEYEELIHHSQQTRGSPSLNSLSDLSFQNYKTLKHLFKSYKKDYTSFSPVSKQVLYQVFII